MAPEIVKLSPARMLFTAIYILIFPVLILLLAGNWLWIEGWIFNIWFIALCGIVIIHLYRHDPALMTERYKKPGSANQEGWDKYMVYGIVLGFIVWIGIMPLDASRFGWSAGFPGWLKIFGGIGLLNSAFLFYRAFADNTFASSLVRIQSERKHQVVTSGVYGLVRHPMYLGGIMLFVGTPLLLGSFWGILMAVAMAFILAARLTREERLLVKELEGYADYQKKVRYRLMPFIW